MSSCTHEGNETKLEHRRAAGALDKAFKDGTIAAESQSVRRIVSAP